MVTDRKILASNGKTTIDLTESPYFVDKITGFDVLDVQIVTSQGFDQDGATLLNSYVLPRDMGIEGQIKADTTYQMQQLRDNIMNVFLPKKTITINHYYGGRNRLIEVMVEKTPKFSFTKISSIQEYSIQMKATEPYWRDVTETLVQVANWVGKFHFPLVIPKDKGVVFGVKQSSLIARVYNRSTIKVGMRFEFIANGEVQNPQLFNINTRESFKLLCNMAAGERITIQTGQEKTVTKRLAGVKENYIGKIDLAGGGNTFLELEPGDNLFRYTADAGEDMLEVKIYYYNKYPGV